MSLPLGVYAGWLRNHVTVQLPPAEETAAYDTPLVELTHVGRYR